MALQIYIKLGVHKFSKNLQVISKF